MLPLAPGGVIQDETTVFTGVKHRIEAVRKRFSTSGSNVIPLRKPPQREEAASWQSRNPWAAVDDKAYQTERAVKVEGPLFKQQSDWLKDDFATSPLRQMNHSECLGADYAGTRLMRWSAA